MFMDTRAQAKRLLGSFEGSERRGMAKTTGCLILALTIVFLPDLIGWSLFAGLGNGGKAALGIMVFAAALWVTEAMPAFAVALLVIGLQIGILGNPGGVWAAEGDTKAWTTFVEPWSSPTMWLFLGGFVLAHASSKTQLDKWLAGMVLGRFATSPAKRPSSGSEVWMVCTWLPSGVVRKPTASAGRSVRETSASSCIIVVSPSRAEVPSLCSFANPRSSRFRSTFCALFSNRRSKGASAARRPGASSRA